ncbi:hypothetical protein CCMA1212_004759 [Trichoderma ghanense]|uniref:Secreted protein n=1 Tax=Trichoderma ghanense TaxID=65468 RepID=A0ABY2H5T4_9HYPO
MHARTCLRLGEISSGLVAFLMLTASSWSVLVGLGDTDKQASCTYWQSQIFGGTGVTNFVCSVVRMEAMAGGTELNELGGGAWIGGTRSLDFQSEHSRQKETSDRCR